MTRMRLIGTWLCWVTMGAVVTGCGDDANPTDGGPTDAGMSDATMDDSSTPDTGVGGDCTLGQTQPCGTDVGECEEGTQTCGSDGTFGACMGGVTPVAETCNGLDDDCDGVDDNGVLTNFWRDADSDTYGDSTMMMAACSMPVGYAANDGDCNDACTNCFPGGTEICDGNDNDCDTMTDEGVATTYYQDMDSDSRGNPAVSMTACSAPLGYVTNADDCNDDCNVCWTGNSEVCDGFDNNCMGGTDEGVQTVYYRDADMDSRGNPSMTMMACTAPTGYVANSDDCNDACNTCWTGNAESCDALDNNCTGGTDEGFACVQGSAQACTTTCGTTGTGVCSAVCLLPGPATCTPPAEVCNSVDEDCDTVVDEGLVARTGGPGSALGNDGKLANITDGYVGVQRRGAVTYAYRVDTAGTIRGNTFVALESANVVSVDIDRISNTAWAVVSSIDGVGVSGRIINLNGSGNPTINDSEASADTSANGVARIAANTAFDAYSIYQSGSSIRLARLDFIGAPNAPTTIPGTQHRPELGMDIAAFGTTPQGFVAAWVTGASPQVQLALISSTGVISSQAAVGAGSNPSVEVDADGNVGVVYVGSDNRPRFHHLTPTLTCVVGGGARNTCAQTLGTLTVNAPAGGFVSQRTLDIAADGSTFWIAARVSDGEQVFRASGSTTHDSIHRVVSAAATQWMSVGAQAGLPLVLRGGSAYTHDTYGCP